MGEMFGFKNGYIFWFKNFFFRNVFFRNFNIYVYLYKDVYGSIVINIKILK